MRNIEYLEKFFKKHNLSGKIKVRYYNGRIDDDYMSEIIFENGDNIYMNDIIFDIDSDLDEGMVRQWMKSRKKDMSLMEWIQTDNHYVPEMDTSSMDEYKKEMEGIVKEMKANLEGLFELYDDGEDD